MWDIRAASNPDSFPVNAYEAESRRASRFFKFGHTPGPINVPPDESNSLYPLTFDLRRNRRRVDVPLCRRGRPDWHAGDGDDVHGSCTEVTSRDRRSRGDVLPWRVSQRQRTMVSQQTITIVDELPTPAQAFRAAPPLDLFANYHPPSNIYDEVFVRHGEPRRHWRKFLAELNRLDHDEFARRWEQSRQVVHENGIAYSAYGDPKDRPRPWELDPLPLLIPQAEWQGVAAGLRQRAQLLELVLADLYGAQRLITDGILPADVIFGHPGFRRPYHGVPPAGGKLVHSYAADLARAADGRWWVLADRSEAPSGVGFSLENRVVISRMLPTIFREANVQRLAPYFIALQETLQQLAMRHRDNPRIVLLSQGPTSQNYFEDAYLARYLGYTLVEGDDLAVRNNDVMLKTLSGLLPVDVILRRPNSEFCDPLELDGHGHLGSAGLLQAIRSGAVAVVNALGSGLVESPIFMAFLPQLCERLLGEPLVLPGVATWWCGQPESLALVLSRIDAMVIKRDISAAGPGSRRDPGAEPSAGRQIGRTHPRQSPRLRRPRTHRPLLNPPLAQRDL